VRRARSGARRAGSRCPFPTLSRLRRFGGRTNILTVRATSVVREGTALTNPFLAEQLAQRRFGDWTIAAQAMNLLEREIRGRPPRRVLEFGCGLSTDCLARYLAESAPDARRPVVMSVEEDADFCAEARALVAELGLAGLARIHHAPLVQQDVGGRSVKACDLPAEVLAELEREPSDLVFIDGPGMAAASLAGPSSTPCSRYSPTASASHIARMAVGRNETAVEPAESDHDTVGVLVRARLRTGLIAVFKDTNAVVFEDDLVLVGIGDGGVGHDPAVRSMNSTL
jgi:hypothetical protein